ncbi:ATP-binding protein [Halothermothrix orenii]|uniref:AAA ATPase n=1 Tax=Halothermothrix orenii (strain H 168 / OCM 544 / DSM 9562) TaxID=373903 RepID=B8D1A6_HALOH|nr:ATP-binding protein [Halothermothrix orenii]ACL71058.1 AAA ATPase [Halothermothrix orenii H 168]
MPFNFDPRRYQGKARSKYLEAQKRVARIHKKYPDVKKVDEYLNYLKREYNYLKVGLFNNKDNDSQKKLEDLKQEIEELEEHFNRLLDKHNIPRDYKEPDWDCPVCHDQGRIYENGRYRICSCVRKEELNHRREEGDLPRHLYKATFDSARLEYYDDNRKTDKDITYRENARLIYSYAHKFATRFSPGKLQRGLLIQGPIGSGKSFLLGCIANKLAERGIDFKYIVYTDLLQKIRNTYHDDSGGPVNEQVLIEEVQNASVLLIDDLGTEKASEFTAAVLYQIIDKRYREERPIIITTNYFVDELKERFEDMFEEMGERIFQRLIEMNRYVCLYGDVRAKIVAGQQEVNL